MKRLRGLYLSASRINKSDSLRIFDALRETRVGFIYGESKSRGLEVLFGGAIDGRSLEERRNDFDSPQFAVSAILAGCSSCSGLFAQWTRQAIGGRYEFSRSVREPNDFGDINERD